MRVSGEECLLCCGLLRELQRGGRREPTLQSCLLTSAYTHCSKNTRWMIMGNTGSDAQNGVMVAFGALDCCCCFPSSLRRLVVTISLTLKRSLAFTVYGVLLNHLPLMMGPVVKDPLKLRGRQPRSVMGGSSVVPGDAGSVWKCSRAGF